MCRRYKARGGWLQGLTPLDSIELNSCATARVLCTAMLCTSQRRSLQLQVCPRHLLQEGTARPQQCPQRRLLPSLARAGCAGISRLLFPQFGAERRDQGVQGQGNRPDKLAAKGDATPRCAIRSLRPSQRAQVVLYQKTQGVMGSVWPEICAYARDIKRLLPSADVLCVAPHRMDLGQQLLTAAAGTAIAAATLTFSFLTPFRRPPLPPLHQRPYTSCRTAACRMRSCSLGTMQL
jgi:hypothetical protein